MEHELSVHDKITADLETARAERDEALEENKGIIYLTPVGVGRVMWVFDDALGAMPISRPWKNKVNLTKQGSCQSRLYDAVVETCSRGLFQLHSGYLNKNLTNGMHTWIM